MQHTEADFPIEQISPIAQREANARRPYQLLHKWWARRLGSVFRTIILSSLIPDEEWQKLDQVARKQGKTAWDWFYYRVCHLTNDNEDHTGHNCAIELIDKYCKEKIILDPFMGGGTTVVEALRLGCRVIGVDLNPVAWFITRKSVEPVDLEKLEDAYRKLERTVAPEILKWYRTQCPEGHKADIMYTFWVRTVRCSSCGQKTRLFKSFRIATKKEMDFVFCPSCYNVQEVKSKTQEVTCAYCGNTFNPQKKMVSRGKFTCEHCGAEDKTVDWVRRTGKAPDYEMFAVEYWCQECYDNARKKGYKHYEAQRIGRGYKGADESNRSLYREACQEFEKVKDTLPLPEGDVYEGMKTTELLNHGIERWQDMFNPRQLLCLGILMRAIMEIEDEAVKEILLVTLNDACDGSNKLCQYHQPGRLARMFARHGYWVLDQPMENNVWGTKLGALTFSSMYDYTRKAVEWTQSPKEVFEKEKVDTYDSPITTVSTSATEVLNDEVRCALFARTSEDLSFLPDRSVDAVVTDPPYYGNVMYGELSDFFYVWLHSALKNEYPEFSSPLVMKSREIVVNEKAEGGLKKDDTFFRQGLMRCFQECNRVLKNEGILVFTFHHEEPEAWAGVLDVVLQAGFDISRVWTYPSETRGGTHGTGIRFDTIIAARKRSGEPTEASWRVLQDEIAAEVQAELKRLLENGAKMSMEDVFVVTIGKALAVYSRHYPLVMRKGKKVILKDAIKDIEGLVNEQIDAYFGLVVPHWLDVVSRIYLQVFAHRKVVTRDQLVKMSSYAGVSFTELEEQELMKRSKKAGVYEVLTPAQREKYLEKIYESNAMTMIDRAHWLYLAYSEGKSLRQVIPKVYEDQLEEVLDAFSAITRDETYKKIAQNVEKLKDKGALF